MRNLLSAGFPTLSDYTSLLETDGFREMESFSNRFLSVNAADLQEYQRKWVPDPLHHWSRQWEYPFVFSRLRSRLERSGGGAVLDAGSGVTFFPYFVKSAYPPADVCCCDSDQSLGRVFRGVNRRAEHSVSFFCADLGAMPFADGRFDVVYCISVLEHTADHAAIIGEFHRILKPGGGLIITFDVSLDGSREISPEEGEGLLAGLAETFDEDEPASHALRSQVAMPGVLTTNQVQAIDADLLPWKPPSLVRRLRSMLPGRRGGGWPPWLTVHCSSFTKRSS